LKEVSLVLYKLPNSEIQIPKNWSKVETYQLLSKLGCPVLNSVLLTDSKELSQASIHEIQHHLQSNYSTLRFQYINPNSKPIRGGNLVKLDLLSLNKFRSNDYQLWFMSPLDRLENNYAINITYRKNFDQIIYEIVGKGFDASDLNRGDLNPHEIIYINPPQDRGNYGYITYRLKVNIVDRAEYLESINKRMVKLSKMGISVYRNKFCSSFEPLPLSMLESIDKYTTRVFEYFDYDEDINISMSITSSNKLIFWDIQTFKNKYETLIKK